MTQQLRIVVTGLIAQYPLGGVAWDYLQYPLGLSLLGHDVYYFEDTGQWPYNPTEGGISRDASFNVTYLASIMERFGMKDRWAYCFPWESQWFGLSDRKRLDVMATADLMINVSGTLWKPERYRNKAILAYVDSDPVFTQVKLARGQQDFQRDVDLHHVHFSFGEALPGAAPRTGHQWHPTRQPVVLPEWRCAAPSREKFTTVMNWTSYNPVRHAGVSYGQKDVEFRRFLDLPAAVAPTVLELAVNAGKTKRTPRDLLVHKGWRLVDPDVVCPDLDSYRQYIQSSRGEWSVAKNGYVVGQAGWFSCRSACYLAAGRPVVVQDTGFSNVLPVGVGIVPFTDLREAADAIHTVVADYDRHSRAAREIADACFGSDQVLSSLVERAMSPGPDRQTGDELRQGIQKIQ
jgi:hypothetical protein